MTCRLSSNKTNRIPTPLLTIILIGILFLPACARQSQPARIEEITFASGLFQVVEVLRLPEGTAPFPVVIFVHGSGLADRTQFGMYLPIMERINNLLSLPLSKFFAGY
jgi:hypothetical protein